MDRKQFYSIAEVAEILDISRWGTYILVKDGHVRAKVPPGQEKGMKVERNELVRLLKRKAEGKRFRRYKRIVDLT